MFNATQFVIDRVRRVTQINLNTGMVDFTGTSIESPQIEFTGESTDKTDANGVLLARFDTAKGVTFSGELSILNLNLMASQLGSEVTVASAGAKVKGEDFAILTVTDGTDVDEGKKIANLKYTPTSTPTYVYTMSEDKNIGTPIKVGVEETEAKITGTKIELPSAYEASTVGVFYEYELENAVKLVDSAEKFADAAKYIVDILAADVCNPASKRAIKIVFPKAKIDNNFTVDLTTEGTHPFSFTAMKDYCADDADLCYVLAEQ